jgi:hypothetical protein
MTQDEQVIEIMKQNGGYATLGFLNRTVDVSKWKSKTPFASIRRIVQDKANIFFKIRPGLWALKEFENEVLQKFQIQDISKKDHQEQFTHSYILSGIIIGNREYERIHYLFSCSRSK